MNSRRFWAGASVLVSLALGAALVSFLLDRPHPPEKPKTFNQSELRARALPTPKSERRMSAVAAIRLPPPPPPASSRTRKQAATRPTPLPKSKPKPKPKPKSVRSLSPEPKPKIKRGEVRPAAPPLKPRKVKTPLPLTSKAKPMHKPEPQRDPPPVVRTPNPAPPTAAAVVPDRATRREGRTLLRLLEYGKGPAIEIAWPESAGSRERLYRRFRDCYGMRNAVMSGDGKLFGETGAAGVPWALNFDRFSGFVRYPAGRTIAAERSRASEIRARHGVEGRLVRIFPRNVDALILGGLRQVIGGAYRDARTITARYGKQGGRLILSGIRVNGRGLVGAVDVSAIGRSGCRA